MRREVDPIGTENATSPVPSDVAAKTLENDIREGIKAIPDYVSRSNHTEAVAFVDGYIRGKGWDVDITDAILVMLMEWPGAVQV